MAVLQHCKHAVAELLADVILSNIDALMHHLKHATAEIWHA